MAMIKGNMIVWDMTLIPAAAGSVCPSPALAGYGPGRRSFVSHIMSYEYNPKGPRTQAVLFEKMIRAKVKWGIFMEERWAYGWNVYFYRLIAPGL